MQNFLSGNREQALGAVGQQLQTTNPGNLADRSNLGNAIRNNIGDQLPNNGNLFKGAFWNNHVNPWGGNSNANWWAPATWAAASNWADWGYSEPLYYDSGYAYYPSDSTTSTQAYQGNTMQQPQATATAQNTSTGDWMPLGVFALTKEGDKNATPTMYLQLALNKDGNIGGTYYNSTSDVSYPVEGTADKDTQQVAWKMSNNAKSPILQTGLYNLTQDQTPVKVNFANGSSQNWLMVRLKQQAG